VGLNIKYESEGVDHLWNLIESRLEDLGLDYSKVVVYNDSLILVNWTDFFEKQAINGSRNFQLLLNFIDGGAILRKTESIPRFLIGMIGAIITILFRLKTLTEKFNAFRERYIAKQINHTLKKEEVGLLFLGAAHHVFLNYLDQDILVKKLITNTEFKKFYDM